MKKLVLGAMIVAMLSGCATTLGQKIYDNRVVVYKVVKKGVTIFLTKEEIAELELDEASTLIEYAYTLDKQGKRVVPGELKNTF